MTNEERTSAGRPLDERSQDGQTVDEPSADGEGVSDYFSTEKIFRRVHATAENEIDHSVQVLFMSGLAAGLSLGPSFVCSAAFVALVPLEEGGSWSASCSTRLAFCWSSAGTTSSSSRNAHARDAGAHRPLSAWMPLRLWGAVMAALVLAHTSVFTPEGAQGAHETARHALEGAWDDLFWKGGFEHCIIGTCETLYLVFSGDAGLGLFLKYFTAVVVGNVAGGVLLVAALNYAQTQDEETPERVEEEKRAP